MDDNAIEQQIQAKGLTAPRVKPSDVTANIASVEYLTHVTASGQILRWAILITACGFAVVGKPSASVSAENDDEQIGKQVAYDNSRDELWPLMGYALKHQLCMAQAMEDGRQAAIAVFGAGSAGGDAAYSACYEKHQDISSAHVAEIATRAMPAHQQRVHDEFNELMDKAIKLRTFTLAPTFQRLADEEQVRLGDQLVAMTSYADILSQRIAAFPAK